MGPGVAPTADLKMKSLSSQYNLSAAHRQRHHLPEKSTELLANFCRLLLHLPSFLSFRSPRVCVCLSLSVSLYLCCFECFWWWMARSNKFSSINFNDIYEKKISSSSSATPTKNHSSRPSPSSSYASATSPHNGLAAGSSPYKGHLTHGRMLVLTRPASAPAPAPKPVAAAALPPPQPDPSPPHPVQNRPEPDSDPISLRPLGRTGAGPSAAPLPSSPAPALEKDREVSFAVTSPKPDKFVPPHLRPGFAGREKRPGPDIQKQGGFRGGEPVPRQQGYYGSPGRYGEDGRPKSGGYDAVRTGGQADLNRASSFGSRPSSSG